MILADGDPPLLESLFEHRFLSSGQLARLSGRSPQVIRRRMRKLIEGAWVLALDRRPTEEAVYALTPRGREWMAQQLGVEKAMLPIAGQVEANRSQTIFFRHELLVSDILIAFVRVLEEYPPLELKRMLREWELQDPKARAAHKRYVLCERFEVEGRTVVHRPDACLLLRPIAAPPESVVAVFIEADRSTESMRRIRRKLDAYYLYWKRERFRAGLGAFGMRVCFVLGEAKTERRIRSMQQTLADFCTQRWSEDQEEDASAFAGLFRFALGEALEQDLLQGPVWYRGLEEAPAPFVRVVPAMDRPVREPAPLLAGVCEAVTDEIEAPDSGADGGVKDVAGKKGMAA